MSKYFFCLGLIAVAFPTLANSVSIIPKPNFSRAEPGEFVFCNKTNVRYDKEFEAEYRYLQSLFVFDIVAENPIKKNKSCSIELKKTAALNNKEGYSLKVNSQGINISAPTRAGIFYAMQSLRQLLAAEQTILKGQRLAAVSITDAPRFKWRGVMLDDSRRFWGVDFVKTFIDRMAYHKFNVLQWHLTDDDGWRIEIKKYPKLTKQGAYRGPDEVIPGRYGGETERYGGFYTQQQIREIVAYASARHITVVPEIDIPAHAKVVMELYPELVLDPEDRSDYVSIQNVPNNTMNPALDSTYQFLDDVFKEVAELFPSQYVHVGGDERPPGSWEKSPAVKRMMQDRNLKDLHEVQSFFFQKVEAILAKHGKSMIGWEEIKEGGHLSQDTAIISWQGEEAGIKAAQNSNWTVMAPAPYTYVDLAHTFDPAEPGLRWAGVLSTARAYSYNPISPLLGSKQRKYIWGVQACLWGETLYRPAVADYMAYPRLAAIAEVAWTELKNKSWADFSQRLSGDHLRRLHSMAVQYRVPQVAIRQKNGLWRLEGELPNLEIRYSTDGSEPNRTSKLYQTPFALQEGVIKAVAYDINGRQSSVSHGFKSLTLHRWNQSIAVKKINSLELPLTQLISDKGNYQLHFMLQEAAGPLQLSDVSLLVNGKEYGHKQQLEIKPQRSLSKPLLLNFLLREYSEENDYRLLIKYQAAKTGRYQGQISLSQAPLLMPLARVSSSLMAETNHGLDNIIDSNEYSVFISQRPPNKGDVIDMQFQTTQLIRSLNWRSGGISHDGYLRAGKLLYSLDGKSYQELASFDNGELSFSGNKAVSAGYLRLQVGADQTENLILRDLKIN